MNTRKKSSTSYNTGLALMFLPVAISILLVLDLLPRIWWIQLLTVLVICACVGFGSYLLWWGRRPQQARREWTPSKTLPKDNLE